jgi:hypothetical protein
MLMCAAGLYLFAANQVVVAAPPRDRCALPPDCLMKSQRGIPVDALSPWPISMSTTESCFKKIMAVDARV